MTLLPGDMTCWNDGAPERSGRSGCWAASRQGPRINNERRDQETSVVAGRATAARGSRRACAAEKGADDRGCHRAGVLLRCVHDSSGLLSGLENVGASAGLAAAMAGGVVWS